MLHWAEASDRRNETFQSQKKNLLLQPQSKVYKKKGELDLDDTNGGSY